MDSECDDATVLMKEETNMGIIKVMIMLLQRIKKCWNIAK